jgi:hypothetical protein
MRRRYLKKPVLQKAGFAALQYGCSQQHQYNQPDTRR